MYLRNKGSWKKIEGRAWALALALGCSGCASLPSLERPQALTPPSGYETAASLAGGGIDWPSDRWWEGYGDPQLSRLIDEALRDQPDLAAASARLRQAEAYRTVAGSALAPQLSASAAVNYQTLSYNYLTPKNQTPNGWNDYGIGTLNLDWEIDFWGKNRARLAAAGLEVAAGRAELAQARLSVAAAVADAYVELARLFVQHDIVARSVEVRKKGVELFAARFENGLENRGGVSQAKARLAAVEGELLAVEEGIGLQRHRIAALVGAGPDRGLSIARPVIKLASAPGLPAELAANLLGRRPDVIAARLLAEAQAQQIEGAKAEFYPNVNLSAFFGFQSLSLDMLARRSSTIGGVGPAFYLPIFTAGRLKGELRATAAAYDAAVAGYNGAVTRALQEVADVGLSRKALSGELVKGETAAASAGEAHRVASECYRGELATYLEVLYAEDVLLDVQRSLANLQSRALTLDVALKRVLGGGYLNKEGN